MQPDKRRWKEIGVSGGFLLAVALITPLAPMLFGAVRYVFENGVINQLVWGMPW